MCVDAHALAVGRQGGIFFDRLAGLALQESAPPPPVLRLHLTCGGFSARVSAAPGSGLVTHGADGWKQTPLEISHSNHTM